MAVCHFTGSNRTISFLTYRHPLQNTNSEVIIMAKKGMKRPEFHHRKNTVPPVPGINGKAKSGKEKANPLIPDAGGKVYHGTPQAQAHLPSAFPALDNDLAVENLTDGFDMTAADLQDLQ